MISNDLLAVNGDDVSAYRGQVNWKRILVFGADGQTTATVKS